MVKGSYTCLFQVDVHNLQSKDLVDSRATPCYPRTGLLLYASSKHTGASNASKTYIKLENNAPIHDTEINNLIKLIYSSRRTRGHENHLNRS